MVNPWTCRHKSRLIECIDDVKTTVVQMRARMPNTSSSDKLIYENTKKQMIQTSNTVIVNALVNLSRGQEDFKNLEHNAAFKTTKMTST